MEKHAYETLKNCLSRKNGDWVGSHDTIMTVWHILKDGYIFEGVGDVFEYFDKPWHWENEMRDLVVDYELNQICDDINRLPPNEALDALDWLDKFGCDSKTIDAIGIDLQETYF